MSRPATQRILPPRMKPYDANDPAAVAEAKKQAQYARDAQLDDIRAVLALPEGRRLVWRLLEHCKVFESTFTSNGSQFAFNEGARNVGLFMLAEVTAADAQVFVTMLKESKQDV